MNSAAPSSDDFLALLAGHRIWGALDAAALADFSAQWEHQGTSEGLLLLPQGRLFSRLGMVVA
ncbi:MAG: hypothetical protein WAT33_03365, partial [Giesbergeria sp.]